LIGHVDDLPGGRIYEPLGSWYHATKFAVEGLSDSLRMELAPYGVQVVVIQPGAIRTEWAGISADHLEASSSGTAYEDQARVVAGMMRASEREGGAASEPEVVARAIARAASSRRPRVRYAVGAGAKPLLYLRRILPDRAFDAVLRGVFGSLARSSARSSARPVDRSSDRSIGSAS